MSGQHTGDLVAELLRRHGVTAVFGVPGGQTAALYDGVNKRSPEIRHVLVRDERSAAYAADAYARLTGRPGVCDVTVGPGTTKLPDGLLEAYNASIPLVAIVGDLPQTWEPLRDHGVGSQGFDQRAMLATMTKQVWTAPDQATVPQLIRAAFRVATTGRPGPTAVIIPHDVFDAPWDDTDADLAVDARHQRVPADRCSASREAVRAAAELLATATRPAIIAGGGVHASRAYELLLRLAERLDAVVLTSFGGKGSIVETSPHSAGVVNPLGSPAAIDLAGKADVVFWLGSKVGQNTSLNWTLPAAGQRTIQLDVDGAELGRTFRPDVALVGDIAETLEVLVEHVPDMTNSGWLSEVATAKADAGEAHAERDDVPIHPIRVMQELDRTLEPDDVVVSDASFAAGWIATHLRARVAARRFLFARGLGGLGYAIPASIGAATAAEGGRVVTVSGDGGASYALGELATHAQHGLKSTHVVLNNGALGWLKVWQHLFFDGLNQSVELESTDARASFSGVAKALGCDGHLVTDPVELAAAFDRAKAATRPTLIEVRCDEWATPVHGYRRRLAEGKAFPRPGTVYEARPWVR